MAIPQIMFESVTLRRTTQAILLILFRRHEAELPRVRIPKADPGRHHLTQAAREVSGGRGGAAYSNPVEPHDTRALLIGSLLLLLPPCVGSYFAPQLMHCPGDDCGHCCVTGRPFGQGVGFFVSRDANVGGYPDESDAPASIVDVSRRPVDGAGLKDVFTFSLVDRSNGGHGVSGNQHVEVVGGVSVFKRHTYCR